MACQSCTLVRFISLVDGNWRNAVFVDACSEASCCLDAPCRGHLFTTERDGEPVVIPAELYQHLTGEQIDPSECRSHISRSDLEDMYRRTLLWLCDSTQTCGVRRLSALYLSLPCSAHTWKE